MSGERSRRPEIGCDRAAGGDAGQVPIDNRGYGDRGKCRCREKTRHRHADTEAAAAETGALVVSLLMLMMGLAEHVLVHEPMFVWTGLGGCRERRSDPEHAADDESERNE